MAHSSAASTSYLESKVDNSRNIDGSFKVKKLVEVALETYTSFNPERVTVDSHGEDSVERHRISNEDDATVVLQILYGVTRYERFLEYLLNAFYYHNSGTAIRGDRPMYAIYAYLGLFRLEELTFPQFKRLVAAQDAQKMIVFLRYLFSEENLKTYCRDEWIKLYDKNFVDDLIANALEWVESDLEGLMVELERKVYLTNEKSKETFEVHLEGKKTVQKPFNLSQPRPKPSKDSVQEPIPPKPTPKPPPPIFEGPTREQLQLEAAHTQNRKAIELKYSDPADRVRLRVLERPNNIDKVRAELEDRAAAEKAAYEERVKPKKVPKAPNAEVKLNTAAILREDALYKKKQAEEAQMILRYEQDLRDDSEFNSWQTKMLAADEAELQAEIDRRRKEMAASAAAAIKAREGKVEENLEAGRKQKEERAKIEARKRRELEVLVEINKKKRAAVQAERVRVKQAQDKVEQGNKLKAEQIRKEEAAHARRMAAEAAIEQQRKMDIIRQLRALEKVKREKVTEFDPTWTPGMGLSCEMSLAELKDRLEMEKRHQEQEREIQREQILKSKMEKEAKLLAKAEQLSRIRKVAAAQASVRKAAAKSDKLMKEATVQRAKEETTLVLDNKLREKRDSLAAEKARLAAEEKRVKFEQMQLAAGAAVVEEKKFEELRAGAQREIRAMQAGKLSHQRLAGTTKAKAQTVRISNVKTDQKQKKDFLKAFDDKLAVLTEEEQQRAANELATKRRMVDTQRTFEQTLIAKQHDATWKPGDKSKRGYLSISERLAEQAEQLSMAQ